jgi:hypothetical protein
MSFPFGVFGVSRALAHSLGKADGSVENYHRSFKIFSGWQLLPQQPNNQLIAVYLGALGGLGWKGQPFAG